MKTPSQNQHIVQISITIVKYKTICTQKSDELLFVTFLIFTKENSLRSGASASARIWWVRGWLLPGSSVTLVVFNGYTVVFAGILQ